jgi:transcriptional regulator with XRE-family HTH domain
MTPAQARAARAMLKLGVRQVAVLARVTPNTVSRVEQDEPGSRGPQATTIAAIRRVYEEQGIGFTDEGDGGVGVRWSSRPIACSAPSSAARAGVVPVSPNTAAPKITLRRVVPAII